MIISLYNFTAKFTKAFKDELTDTIGYFTGLNAFRNKPTNEQRKTEKPDKTTDALLKALQKDNLTIAKNTKNNVQKVITSQNNNIVNTSNTLPGTIAKYVSPQRSTFDVKNIDTDTSAEDEFIRKLAKAICKCIENMGCCEGGVVPAPMPFPTPGPGPGRLPVPVPGPMPFPLPLPRPESQRVPVPIPQRIPGRVPIPIPVPPINLPIPIPRRTPAPIALPAPSTSSIPILTDDRLNQSMRTVPVEKIKEPIKVPIEPIKTETSKIGGPRNPKITGPSDVIDVQAKEVPKENLKIPNTSKPDLIEESKKLPKLEQPSGPNTKPPVTSSSSYLPDWAKGWKIPGAVSGLFAGYEMYETEQAKKEGKISQKEASQRHGGTIGSVGGGLAGAYAGGKVGAGLGTFFGPLGTLIGGIGGGLIGGAIGSFGGGKAGEAVVSGAQELSNLDVNKNISAYQMFNAQNENWSLKSDSKKTQSTISNNVLPIDNSQTTNNFSSASIRQDDPSIFGRQAKMWNFDRRPMYG